jgi:membrane protease YdiL (CAAX protease family)
MKNIEKELDILFGFRPRKMREEEEGRPTSSSIELSDMSDKALDMEGEGNICTADDGIPPAAHISDVQLSVQDEESGDLNTTESSLYPCAAITYISAVECGQAVPQTWGGLDVFVTLCLWLCVSFVGGLFLSLFINSVGLPSVIVIHLLCTWIALAGWPIYAAYSKGNGPIVDFGVTLRGSDFGWGIVYGVAAVVVVFGLASVTQMIFGKFDSNAGELLQGSKFTDGQTLLFLCLIAFGAPIVEEIYFRGLVFASLGKSSWIRSVPHHPILVVFLCGGYFAVFHLEPVRIMLLLGGGLVLSLCRYHTASLTPSIIAHMSLNSLPLIVFLLDPSQFQRHGGLGPRDGVDPLDLIMATSFPSFASTSVLSGWEI